MKNRFAGRIAALAAALLVSGGAAAASPKFSGLYWNPSESGWGVAVDQQGDTVFAVLLHYGPAGQPTWYVMPDMPKDNFNPFVGSRTIHEGALYQPTAARNPAATKSSIYASEVVVSNMGTAGINFESAGDSAFWYQIGGYNGYKMVRPLVFSQSAPVCQEDDGALVETKNYQGMWWNAPAGSENGWGLYLAHQGDVVFAVSLGYDEAGAATWLSMALTKGEPDSYQGAVIRTTGPAYDTAFDPDAVTRTEVGTASLDFSDGDNGVFALVLNDGAQPMKNITRLRFSESRTVCR